MGVVSEADLKANQSVRDALVRRYTLVCLLGLDSALGLFCRFPKNVDIFHQMGVHKNRVFCASIQFALERAIHRALLADLGSIYSNAS